VPRSAPGDDDVFVLWVEAQQEVLVRRVLEEARLQRRRRPGSLREVALGKRARVPGLRYPGLQVRPLPPTRGTRRPRCARPGRLSATSRSCVGPALLDDQIEGREARRREEFPSRAHARRRSALNPRTRSCQAVPRPPIRSTRGSQPTAGRERLVQLVVSRW
jgi:hypothetical protein